MASAASKMAKGHTASPTIKREQRAACNPGLALLSARDIVEMLKETLPRKPQGRDALARESNERHQRRRDAIASRLRHQQRQAPSQARPMSVTVTLSN